MSSSPTRRIRRRGAASPPPWLTSLFAAGADVLTLGDHTWDQKEIMPYLDREPRIVRPANFAPGCPGRGVTTVETPKGRLSVLSLIGRVFMPPADCPFRTADEILKKRDQLGTHDFRGNPRRGHLGKNRRRPLPRWARTSVVGTHTHVQTSDEAILPKGTAYLTDLGMTGPKDSVLGRALDPVLKKFLTGLPTKFEVATNDVALEGVIVTVDPKTGRATKIKRIRETN
jgi:metallophosphoesterase (TIGR00282 family)